MESIPNESAGADANPPAGEAEPRTARFCIASPALPDDLRALLGEYCESEGIEVLAERRSGDRRTSERRAQRESTDGGAGPPDRRLVRADDGRRVAERRAEQIAIAGPSLPAELGGIAGDLRFVERHEAGLRQLEEIATARLLIRIEGRDPTAFGELYDRHAPALHGFLRAMLGDPHAGEDASEEVWAAMLRCLGDHERRDLPFRVWFFRVARDWAVEHLEARELAGEPQPESEPHAPTLEAANAPATDGDLLEALREIPLGQRQVLVLRFVADLTPAEVAEVIGRSPDEVKKLQARGQASLRDKLDLGPPSSSERREPRLNVTRLHRPSRVATARRLALSWTL